MKGAATDAEDPIIPQPPPPTVVITLLEDLPSPTTTPTPIETVLPPPPPTIDATAAAYATSVRPPAGLVLPTPAPASAIFYLTASHYGAADFQGKRMGCPPITMPSGRPWGNLYETSDPQIVAVGSVLAAVAPCGTPLNVCGPAGCIDAYRMDSCGGCDVAAAVDLSEAGITAVCGGLVSCPLVIRVGK